MKKHSEMFQYDSCISRGICSINPRTSALIIVLILYLKLLAKYAVKLSEKEALPDEIRLLVLNTAAIAVSGEEFTEDSYSKSVAEFKKILPEIIEKCSNIFEDDFFKNEEFQSSELFRETENITASIKFGEKVLRKTLGKITLKLRDLHQIALVIIKSISINLIYLEDMGIKDEESFSSVLEVLNSLDISPGSEQTIQTLIKKTAKTNINITKKLREIQEEKYGKQSEANVSYTTTPGKAVLVVGSDICELEIILNALKNSKIDVYTHDEMMIAHTFPKFREYKHLKGQFGQGLENCLIDFATFPGPIILTKHSLHNIENLYRGRLFTTDNTLPKGVIKIKDNNYEDVIQSALSAKGFKRGKQCESTVVGYDFEKTITEIKNKLTNGYKRVLFIGLEKYSLEQDSYFEKLIKHSSNETLIISFSYNYDKENLIHVNACFDSLGLIKIFDKIYTIGLPITIFMTKCNRNTISEMIYLSDFKSTAVYVGKCTPILLNPSLIQTLQNIFSIKEIKTAREDLKEIES